jgi:RNA polymerase sigma factor (sigma-70 family)
MTPEIDARLSLLAEQAVAGQRQALEDLCQLLQGPIYRLALRVLSNPEEAQDATQDILIQVVTHLSQFRAESRVLTWVYAIATRHCLRLRAKAARPVEALAERIRAGLNLAPEGALPEGEVHVLERETRMGCTQAMLDSLSLDERVAVVLSEVLGADDQLGARLSGTTPVAYRKRLSRVRDKLRPILESLCGLMDPSRPCSCARQALAKQIAGEAPARARLPIITDRARELSERLGEMRRFGSVFAQMPAVAPPETAWPELQAQLSTLLGSDPRYAKGRAGAGE